MKFFPRSQLVIGLRRLACMVYTNMVYVLGIIHTYTYIYIHLFIYIYTYDIHKFRRKDKACLNFNMIFGHVNKRLLDVLEHWMLQGGPKKPVVNGVKCPPPVSQFVELILIVQKSHSTTTFLGCMKK